MRKQNSIKDEKEAYVPTTPLKSARPDGMNAAGTFLQAGEARRKGPVEGRKEGRKNDRETDRQTDRADNTESRKESVDRLDVRTNRMTKKKETSSV